MTLRNRSTTRLPSLPQNKKSRRHKRKTSNQTSFSNNIPAMFAAIDKYLVQHTPPWYRTPVVQTSALGLVFFWVFAAYTTVQFYSASIYGSALAADCVSAVYLTFTVTCLVAPGIINKFGCRLAMFVGVICYGNLVLASLIYFEYGGEDVLWARRLVVAGGAVLGVGASALWTAQGRLILQYATRAEELESEKNHMDSNSSGDASKGKAGTLMSIFWSIFQCSSLVGGSISFIYYNKKPEGSTSLYIIFLGFIFIGAIFTQFLLPPAMLQIHDRVNEEKDLEMKSEQTPLKVDSTAQYDRGDSQSEKNESRATMNEDLSTKSWFEEAKGTIQIFFTQEMTYLSPLFMYTGFNQPYQQATFGNRFFTKRSIGAELIIFHLMEIIGAIVVGQFLDNEKFDSSRKRAIICLGLFVLVNGTGNAIAFFQEFSARHSVTLIANDISEIRAIIPSTAFALWGFADAQIQVYCYWLIGSFYKSGHDHSRAVGWYKCVQSLGTAIGFFLIPSQRLNEVAQLSVSSLLFLVGTALSFTQLPSKTVP